MFLLELDVINRSLIIKKDNQELDIHEFDIDIYEDRFDEYFKFAKYHFPDEDVDGFLILYAIYSIAIDYNDNKLISELHNEFQT